MPLREHLTENELTIFDILTRPGPKLSGEELGEVKKVAHHLLERVKALDWRKRASARAQVRMAIEDALDEGLPRAYAKDLYQSKCATVFEHVYESYFGDGGSVFRDTA
jgi:type I restriction enzyme R subunit